MTSWLRTGSTLALLATPFSALAVFTDVPATHQNYEAIVYAEQQVIVKGYPDGTFHPQQPINRAELTKIIVGAAGKEMGGQECFSDVKKEWFAPAVCAAKALGIIGGYDDGSFKPAANITFPEAAKIIVNAMGIAKPDVADPWYAPYIAALSDNSAIPTSITSLHHQLTRGEMAEIIFRLRTKNTQKPSSTAEQLTGIAPGSTSSRATQARSAAASSRSAYSAGITVDVVNNRYYIVAIAARSAGELSGFRTGDELQEFDGQPLLGKKAQQVQELLDGKQGRSSELKIARGGTGIQTVTLNRTAPLYTEGQWVTIDGYAALLLTSFDGTPENLVKQMPKDAKGYIFDFRDNTDYNVQSNMGTIDGFLSRFLPKGTDFVHVSDTTGSRTLSTSGSPDVPSSVPVVVIVNSRTYGTAEFIASALQEQGRATVIGSNPMNATLRTFGDKVHVGKLIEFYFLRDGVKNQVTGVTVDVPVRPAAGTQDAVITEAVNILEQ